MIITADVTGPPLTKHGLPLSDVIVFDASVDGVGASHSALAGLLALLRSDRNRVSAADIRVGAAAEVRLVAQLALPNGKYDVSRAGDVIGRGSYGMGDTWAGAGAELAE